MKKQILRTILAVGMLLVLAGCGTGKPQVMTLSLDSNPTTGYTWTVAQDPELFDVSEEYRENDHEKGMTGVGGQQIFSLTPKQAGTTDVTFTYARPWEDPESASTVVSYTVEVTGGSMQIKVQASRFAGGDDMGTLPQIPEPEIR